MPRHKAKMSNEELPIPSIVDVGEEHDRRHYNEEDRLDDQRYNAEGSGDLEEDSFVSMMLESDQDASYMNNDIHEDDESLVVDFQFHIVVS